MAENILFDLDGTLTEPRKGIVRCIEYSLEKMNYPIPADSDLSNYIGPPLQASFGELLETKDSDLIDTAIFFFRERFREKGQYENSVYDGINELLTKLTQQKKQLFVATSKPEIFAANILNHFNLTQYFTGIYGSLLDGTRSDKTTLIKYLMDEEKLSPEATIMIGDRKHDIAGATSNKLDSIGVLWGYGTKEELKAAEATYLCSSVPDIADLVL